MKLRWALLLLPRAVDAADYVPRDKTAERNWRFDLEETLARTLRADLTESQHSATVATAKVT